MSESTMSDTIEGTIPESTMPSKTKLKDNRQKLMTLKARIRYRKNAIKGFRKHAKNGTFPHRMKSIKPYPKMSYPESQKLIDAACVQVQCAILDVMIQEEEKKLKEDREACKTLLAQRQSDRKHLRVKKPKKLKKPILA